MCSSVIGDECVFKNVVNLVISDMKLVVGRWITIVDSLELGILNSVLIN